ncbi:zinc-binding dehydrogenase [Streptomyces sp. NPDC001982]|uniref:alcohol dehydrogenase catalytic domain-containing protein n=1 Tax=unclassified Streptomyces TaxID=2593676 RepID=UPI00331DCD8D
MRAAVLHAIGDTTLQVRDDVETVATGPNQIKVRVHAASLCHSDLSVMNGTLIRLAPVILGHEGAGEVIETGEDVTRVKPGDRVIICWRPPCGDCPACRRGQGNLCAVGAGDSAPTFRIGRQEVHSFINSGTFAEETVISEAGAFPMPDGMSYEIAALIGCAVTTGVGAALNTARIGPGASVAVIGLGGVGIAAVQGARVAGAACVIGVDPVAERRDQARKFGATEAVAPEALADASARWTGGEGFDHLLEAVGTSATVRAAFDATRRGGSVTVIGAGSAETQIPVSLYELLTEKTLQGSYYGGRDVYRVFEQVIELWREGRLNLDEMITHRVGLGDINEALAQMRSGEALRTTITLA